MTKIEQQAMEAIIGIHRDMKKANEPDWEKRRYEIAKEVFSKAGQTACSPTRTSQKRLWRQQTPLLRNCKTAEGSEVNK